MIVLSSEEIHFPSPQPRQGKQRVEGVAGEVGIRSKNQGVRSKEQIILASYKLNKQVNMQPSKSFKDLIVWQKTHQFVPSVYKYSGKFPKEESYCLTSQFRRAAISITANIAEGFAKRTKPDKIRMMNISQGSLEECRYYVILSNDLGYGENEDLNQLSEEVK